MASPKRFKKLTEAKVKSLVLEVKNGAPRVQVAKKFGVAYRTVWYHCLKAGLPGPRKTKKF